MRYLSKIVFIESAGVKYAEINLDGNVHLIGTQGVGKSTLLRAFLFFYNANQLKLGIPSSKKSFTEFYFPYQNSYIIYEVTRETGLFSVLLYKSQGRVCFRFLDTPYDKKFFIEADGRIKESWEKIRAALGSETGYTRKRIERYEEYRNIIYGNNSGLPAEFRKYAIMESKQYQNIPRAIQHVFLNYKVESDFIKDTIIKSLNDEDIMINLSNYTEHLKKIDTQLTDIRKWSEKTRSGEIPVRKQAEEVISLYHYIHFNQQEKQRLAAELAWKWEETRKQEPICRRKLEKEEEKKETLEKRKTSLLTNFEKKKTTITAQITTLKDKLDLIKERTEEYNRQNIAEIITRVARKEEQQREKENLTSTKALLEEDFKDISRKYEAHISMLSVQTQTFRNHKEAEAGQAKSSFYEEKEKLGKECNVLIKSITDNYHDKLQLARETIEANKDKVNHLRLQKTEIKHRRYYELETERCKNDIATCIRESEAATAEKERLKNETETMRRQGELEVERLETGTLLESEQIAREINEIKLAINSIELKLEASKDSLYGWLNTEYPGWEKTIGKVIDEENILFAPGLSPQKTPESNSFYGVQLDLSAVDKTIRTVDDYQKEKKLLQRKLEAAEKRSESFSNRLSADKETIRKKYKIRINTLKQNTLQQEYTIEQATQKLARARLSLDEYTEKAAIEKKHELSVIENDIEKSAVELEDSKNKLLLIEAELKKKTEQQQKERDKKIRDLERDLNERTNSLKEEIRKKEQETENSIKELKEKQLSELQKKGVDTEAIKRIDSKVDEINRELEFINSHISLVERYKYDKEVLFDNAEYFKSQKKSLEFKLSAEQEKAEAQLKKTSDEILLIEQRINGIRQELALIVEDLGEVESFITNDNYRELAIEETSPDAKYKTDLRCRELIKNLYETYSAGQRKQLDLHAAVNKFTGNFSVNNTFNFKTIFTDDADYMQFAGDLKEFMEADLIVTYEKNLNVMFADIIKQLGRETTELLSKEGQIKGVIKNINDDFEARRNFAGVIRKIELRLVTSKSTIIELLTQIKNFNDENIDSLGSMNLFSAGEQIREANNKRATELLTTLSREISNYKRDSVKLTDSFELEFKVIENDNDTGWVSNIANVGSDGTDILVKAMINIMLLNVFKEGATKNRFKDFKLHCMMDEIGKLHPNNVKGLLKFANDRNIFLINGSPQSFDATAYRYTYKLSRQINAQDGKSVTVVKRILTNNRTPQ